MIFFVEYSNPERWKRVSLYQKAASKQVALTVTPSRMEQQSGGQVKKLIVSGESPSLRTIPLGPGALPLASGVRVKGAKERSSGERR